MERGLGTLREPAEQGQEDAGDGGLADERIASQMALVRRVAELGRSARATASIRIRQPLARALVTANGLADLGGEFRALVTDELNVRTLQLVESTDDGPSEITVRPNFRSLGPRFGRDSAAVGTAIEAASPVAVAASLRSTGILRVHVGGTEVVLTAQDVLLARAPLPGWSMATDGDRVVALDLEITPELRREGLAREVVRLVQDARKADGLAMGDHIEVLWSAESPDLALALAEHGSAISADVLASAFGPRSAASPADPSAREHVCPGLGLAFALRPVAPRGHRPADQPTRTLAAAWSGWHALHGTHPPATAASLVTISKYSAARKRIRMHSARWYLAIPGTHVTMPASQSLGA